MKNFRSISMMLLAGLMGLSAQAQQTFTLKLTQPKDSKTTKYLIYLADEKFGVPEMPNDSILIKKGKGEYKNATLAGPRPAIIQIVKPDGMPSQMYAKTFFIPGETLNINVDGDEMKFSGSDFYNQGEAFMDMVNPKMQKMQDIVAGYRKAYRDTPKEKRDSLEKATMEVYNKAQQDFSTEMDAYLDAHAKEEGCAITGMLTFGDSHFFDKMDPSVRNGRFKAYLDFCKADLDARIAKRDSMEKAAQAAMAKSAAGEKFTDFECEYDGKVQKLSDYVGKGQYVLVDFWASWCGPCKQEIPNLIKVYNTYKSDKFNVIGVATWDKPADTQKAIEQLGIPYPQIMNAQDKGSKAYGIQGIPQIILFGPDGTILKRDLRGEDIEKTVKEYLGN